MLKCEKLLGGMIFLLQFLESVHQTMQELGKKT